VIGDIGSGSWLAAEDGARGFFVVSLAGGQRALMDGLRSLVLPTAHRWRAVVDAHSTQTCHEPAHGAAPTAAAATVEQQDKFAARPRRCRGSVAWA